MNAQNCIDSIDRSQIVPPLRWRSWLAQGVRLLGRDAMALVRLVKTWDDRARQRRALAALDARLLADIGRTAGQVRTEADKPFWQD